MKNIIKREFIYGLIMGMLVLVAFGFRGQDHAPVEGGQKWEYLVVTHGASKKEGVHFFVTNGKSLNSDRVIAAQSNGEAVAKMQNTLGAEGWELESTDAGYVYQGGSVNAVHYFKRPVQ